MKFHKPDIITVADIQAAISYVSEDVSSKARTCIKASGFWVFFLTDTPNRSTVTTVEIPS